MWVAVLFLFSATGQDWRVEQSRRADKEPGNIYDGIVVAGTNPAHEKRLERRDMRRV